MNKPKGQRWLWNNIDNGYHDCFILESQGDGGGGVIIQVIEYNDRFKRCVGDILGSPSWDSNYCWTYLEGQDAPL
jgi:hypothetical protein